MAGTAFQYKRGTVQVYGIFTACATVCEAAVKPGLDAELLVCIVIVSCCVSQSQLVKTSQFAYMNCQIRVLICRHYAYRFGSGYRIRQCSVFDGSLTTDIGKGECCAACFVRDFHGHGAVSSYFSTIAAAIYRRCQAALHD